MPRFLKNKLVLSSISGLLFIISWSQYGLGFFSLFAFIPLLVILNQLLESNSKIASTHFFLYSLISFLIFNIGTSWWLIYSTIPGAITILLLSSIFMAITMYLVFLFYKVSGKRIGNFAFITFWIAYEYIIMHSEFSWGWLALGNAFSNNIALVQWYEFTGNFGGTLWILITNLLLFEVLTKFNKNKKAFYKSLFAAALALIIPISYSLIRFYTYKEATNPISVVIIQPNIDPYNQKFKTPIISQTKIITDIAKTSKFENPDYFIAPETAISNGFYEKNATNDISIIHILDFLGEYPNSQFVIGATTRVKYTNKSQYTNTCHIDSKQGFAYDIFNTSMQISPNGDIQFYHKGVLVPGVETTPFPKFTKLFTGKMKELGGIEGSHGIQENREIFTNNDNYAKPGVAICYESVFGELMSDFVNEGANVLFIITNDGWWKNTAGHRKHMSLSKLRAVETRRSIARSANTGISCIINQKGQVCESIGWWQKGQISANINLNNNETFYVKHGDYLARMCLMISIILIVMMLLNKTMRYLKRDEKLI